MCIRDSPDVNLKLKVNNISNVCVNLHAHHNQRRNTSQHNDFQEDVIKIMETIEVTSAIWFTVDYFVRFFCSPNKVKFLKSFLNTIDLISILPFYIVAILESERGSSLGVIRVFRLVRVLRVFKLSRHSIGLQIIGSTLKTSISDLGMMFCVLCFSVITFSSAIYYAEHDLKNAQFTSIPDAFWYTLVTMTTVGYGDQVPTTIAGKLIGGLCAVSGVVTIAMVIPIIVTNFEFHYKKSRISAARKQKKKILNKEFNCNREEKDDGEQTSPKCALLDSPV